MSDRVRCILVVFFTLALGAAVVPALAHHSFTSEFNEQDPRMFTGVLTKIEWINPHVQLYLDAKDDKNQPVKLRLESGPTNRFRALHLNRNDFELGQVFTVRAYMAKDGSIFGFIRNFTFVGGSHDGQRYETWGGGLDENGNPIQ